MELKDLQSLFVHQLKDIYSAEKQLTKALPKVAKAAGHEALRDAIQNHLEETHEQVKRLERIFKALDMTPRAVKCQAMEGLIAEADELIQEADADPKVLDVGLIGAAQKVEHYEIAAYGTLKALARQLGHDDIVSELQATLDEEKAADEKLNELALQAVNQDAEPVAAGAHGSEA